MKVISQTESRIIAKWIHRKYSFRVDGFFFWRMTTKEAAKKISERIGVAVPEEDILKVIRL